MKVKLEKYVDKQIKAIKSLMKSKYQTIEKSTDIATNVLDKRLDSMNEFRASLKDQQKTFLSRKEFDILHQKVCDDIRMLRESKANLEGKASQLSVFITLIIALLALALSAITIFV